MHHRSLLSSIVLAGVAAISLTATGAQAQGLFDFLWGGTQEWGGSRQTVSFDPKYTPGQIIVSFGDRRLYLITRKGQATSYPIAVPREQSRWQGTTIVSDKRVNPSWRPTPDMMKENPKLPTWVPGGHPMNPLGVRAMYLGASTYRIHGTDAPWTIGQAVSKGCIRMLNEDVLDLYPRVPVGMRVTVTWQRFSDQAVASSDAASPPPPFEFGNHHGPPRARVIRNLPPQRDDEPMIDDAVENAQTAAVRMEPVRALEEKPAKPSKKADTAKSESAKAESAKSESAKSEPAKSEPAKSEPAKAETAKADSKSETPKAAEPPSAAATAAEAAQRAADAATKAAESARQAAEEAKKAVEDAKKATAADTAKSAAL